eukprot:3420307-Pleurochrysis_carterae.AAC.1
MVLERDGEAEAPAGDGTCVAPVVEDGWAAFLLWRVDAADLLDPREARSNHAQHERAAAKQQRRARGCSTER